MVFRYLAKMNCQDRQTPYKTGKTLAPDGMPVEALTAETSVCPDLLLNIHICTTHALQEIYFCQR